jgi:uncharacterized membrane-anchored protein YhcB (DUF1043 family)
MVSLDGQSSLWVIGILCLLIGAALGCMITYALMARNGRTHQLQLELNQLKDSFRDYRDQVTHHFMRTSELVQEMTHSYRSVYEHLASGAQRLCGELDPAALEATGASRLDNQAGRDTDDMEVDYDEFAELHRIRSDIDELLGDSPRISDLDLKRDRDDKTLQH